MTKELYRVVKKAIIPEIKTAALDALTAFGLDDDDEKEEGEIDSSGGDDQRSVSRGKNVKRKATTWPDCPSSTQLKLGSFGEDFKSHLNVFTQKSHLPPPTYETAYESETDGSGGFVSTVAFQNRVFKSSEPMSRIKLAEQNAAQVALYCIDQVNCLPPGADPVSCNLTYKKRRLCRVTSTEPSVSSNALERDNELYSPPIKRKVFTRTKEHLPCLNPAVEVFRRGRRSLETADVNAISELPKKKPKFVPGIADPRTVADFLPSVEKMSPHRRTCPAAEVLRRAERSLETADVNAISKLPKKKPKFGPGIAEPRTVADFLPSVEKRMEITDTPEIGGHGGILSLYQIRRNIAQSRARLDKLSPAPSTSVQSKDNFPLLQFPGQVHYIQNQVICGRICEELMFSSPNLLVCGFDSETKPTFVKGQKANKTAIVQICPSESECYVFQISIMSKGFPTGLKRLLQDKNILKVGVGINGDMKKLLREYQFQSYGILDLSVLMNKHCAADLRRPQWGLNSLLNLLVHKRLDKRFKIKCSNWESCPLSKEQLNYAATDAYAGLLIYQRLTEDFICGTANR